MPRPQMGGPATVTFARVHTVRRSQAVVDQIREAILKGSLRPGERLPAERELVRQFQVSRASIREAMRMLEVLGLIDVQAGSGCYVRDISEDVLLAPLSQWLLEHRASLAQFFEFRQIVETGAAELAASRATRQDLQALRESQERMAAAVEQGDVLAAIVADSDFHRAVWRAARNTVLLDLSGTLLRLLEESRKASLRVPGQPARALAGHLQVLTAIEERAPQRAGHAMRKHLQDAWYYIEEAMRADGQSNAARAQTYHTPVTSRERGTHDAVASEQGRHPSRGVRQGCAHGGEKGGSGLEGHLPGDRVSDPHADHGDRGD